MKIVSDSDLAYTLTFCFATPRLDEQLIPTFGLNRPAHTNLRPGLDQVAPYGSIMLVSGDIVPIDDRHPARELALGLHID